MECGEIDFAHILAKHQGRPLGLNFIRVYWEQMLRAVQAIHDEKIVHSDLKPANFLLIQVIFLPPPHPPPPVPCLSPPPVLCVSRIIVRLIIGTT